eukprot:gb/GECG01009589.1/.p1 GENE.gb/GECG01009589.1/~~gb/GECG01009589.1/.p1  ORF type:complete len:140 (+),score=24.44 gb/GECG01009589.1/:1-420(+)
MRLLPLTSFPGPIKVVLEHFLNGIHTHVSAKVVGNENSLESAMVTYGIAVGLAAILVVLLVVGAIQFFYGLFDDEKDEDTATSREEEIEQARLDYEQKLREKNLFNKSLQENNVTEEQLPDTNDRVNAGVVKRKTTATK